MFIITLMIGIITGLIAYTVLGRFITKLPILTLLTVLIIVLVMSLNKIYVISYINANTYEYFLKKNDLVCRLIAIAYPNKFNAFIKKIKQIIRENKGKDTQLFFKIELLNTIFNITASKATNQSLHDYYETEITLYENLYNLDPTMVLYMEFSSKYKHMLNPSLGVLLNGEENLNKLIAKKEAVILSALQTPQPPITTKEKEQAAELLRGVFIDLAAEYGNDMMAEITTDPTDPELDKAQAASFIISFYKKILALNADDVGLIFKYFYSAKTPSEDRDETGPRT
jgi:hypothetical protein